MKVLKSSLYHGIELLLLYQIAFVKFPYLSWYLNFQRLATVLLFIMSFPHVIKVFRCCNKSLMRLVTLYIVFIIITSVVNRNKLVTTNAFVGGVLYALAVWDMAFVMFSTVNIKGTKFILKIFFYLTIMYVVITDALIFFNPYLFGGGYYFVGNKFSVGYKHIELMMLTLLYEEKNELRVHIAKIVLLCLVTYIVSLKIQSATGVACVIFFLIVYFLIPERLLYNPLFFPSILIGSALIVFAIDIVLTWDPIEIFITEILGRDMSLTGRTYIYAAIPRMIKGHLLFGYGYNTAYEIWTSYSWYTPNAQNGLINFIFEQGLFSAICVVLYGIKSFSLVKNRFYQHMFKPIAVLIIVYSLIATIEINIDITFVAFLIMFSAVTLQIDGTEEKILCMKSV